MRKTRSARVILLTLMLVTIVFANQALAFEDVREHWAEEAILNLSSRGIVQGYSPNIFLPDQVISRGEVAALLVISMGLKDQAQVLNRATASFEDVNYDHWAKGYIEAAREYQLVKGYDDNSFVPEQGMTREELAVMMARTMGILPKDELDNPSLVNQKLKQSFKDAGEISDWARGGVWLTRELGLIVGFTDGSFRPKDQVTRAQVVQMLDRMLTAIGQGYQFYGIVQGGDPNLNKLEVEVNHQQAKFTVAADNVAFDNGKKGDWHNIVIFTPIFFNLNEKGEINLITTASNTYSGNRFKIVSSEKKVGVDLTHPKHQQAASAATQGNRSVPQKLSESTNLSQQESPGVTSEVTASLMKVPQLKTLLNVSGEGVKIAIVDSGIDPGHPDLLETAAGQTKITKVIDITDEGKVEMTGNQVKLGRLSLPGFFSQDMTVVMTGAEGDYLVYLSPPGDVSLLNFLSQAGVEAFKSHIDDEIAANNVKVLGDRGFSVYQSASEVISIPLEQGALNIVIAEIAPEGRWVKFFFDGNGHGTHVAGIIGAQGEFSGIAPGAELIIVKALDSHGEADVDDIKRGIKEAVDSGADIINLSLGYQLTGGEYGTDLGAYIEAVSRKHGVTFVVAAGNNGPGINSIATPGDSAGVITVGAYIAPEMWEQEYGLKLDQEILYSFSSVGPGGYWGVKPDVVAPGVVRSTFPQWGDIGTKLDEGTSMAAPHVTGVLALILEEGHKRGEAYSPQRLKQALHLGAQPIEGLSYLEQGYGKVNALATWQSINRVGEPSEGIKLGYLLDEQQGHLYLRQFAPGIVDVALTNFSNQELQVELTAQVPWLSPALEKLRLPSNSTRNIPVYFDQAQDSIGTQGIKMGLLTATIKSGQRFDLTNTVIKPLEPVAGQLTKEGRLAGGQMERYFIRVAKNTETLSASLRIMKDSRGNPLGRARIHLFDPSGIEWQMSPFVGAGQTQGRLADTIKVDYPDPGVWEVVVASSSWLDYYGLADTRYILSIYDKEMATWTPLGVAPKDEPWVIGTMPPKTVTVAGNEQVLWITNPNSGEFYHGLVLINNSLYQVKEGKLLVHAQDLSSGEVLVELLKH